MPQISGDTSSAQTCALARYWVHSCVERHPNCSKNIKVRLPSRVVLIEYDAIERAYGTRLVETSRAVGRYCCLSHRWGKPGGSPMPQTTQENYAQHLERIPFRSLTETFIDAIIMAHRLGLKFIWIDSLCIIQGNRDDWAVESKRMGSYYSNAYVTISASWGDDPEDGCFSLAAQEYMARKVEIRDHGKEYSIYTRRTLDHGYYWPLLRRGWVFQERLLSPRIIHFGQEELVWECLSETTCECGQSDTLQAQLSNKVDYSHILHDNFDLKAFRNLWRHLVEQYTTLELTYISDRFPAIAGLAAEMGRRRPSRYMYGLWEDSLIGDMLWTNWKGSGDHLPPRPLDMEAPTWSWASICDFIKYNKLGVQITPSLKERPYESVEETYADILSPLYSPGTQRSCGAELDPPACIVLRGPVIRASVCHGPMHHPPNPEYYKTSESAILKRLQESYEEKKHELKSELTLQGDDPRDTFKRYYFVPDYGLFHKGQYFVDPDSELLVVIMASVVYHAENSKQNRTDKSVLGIVVRSVYGEMGKYERVGFFHHDGDDCKVKVFERVEEKMVIKLI